MDSALVRVPLLLQPETFPAEPARVRFVHRVPAALVVTLFEPRDESHLAEPALVRFVADVRHFVAGFRRLVVEALVAVGARERSQVSVCDLVALAMTDLCEGLLAETTLVRFWGAGVVVLVARLLRFQDERLLTEITLVRTLTRMRHLVRTLRMRNEKHLIAVLTPESLLVRVFLDLMTLACLFAVEAALAETTLPPFDLRSQMRRLLVFLLVTGDAERLLTESAFVGFSAGMYALVVGAVAGGVESLLAIAAQECFLLGVGDFMATCIADLKKPV